MPFREPIVDQSLPEDDYSNRTDYISPDSRVRPKRKGSPLKQHFKWLHKTLNRIKNWLVNIGRGYFYTIVGIFCMSLLPVLVVRNVIMRKINLHIL